jgi:heterodisulfide reductase subunit B
MNYELSARRVAQDLGIELLDVDEFDCCGFPVKNVDIKAALVMAARNLCVAQERGLDICTLCSGCASFLSEANSQLMENEELRREINTALGTWHMRFQGSTSVRHFARILYEEIGSRRIEEKVSKDLSALHVACHYGCHYLKPAEALGGFDDPEHPQSLDHLIKNAGASVIDYADKKGCCGNVILAVNEDISMAMAKKKLDNVSRSRANALVVACPACGFQFDNMQMVIETDAGDNYELPVLYFPQLLGLAFGREPEELGLDENRVSVDELLEELAQ